MGDSIAGLEVLERFQLRFDLVIRGDVEQVDQMSLRCFDPGGDEMAPIRCKLDVPGPAVGGRSVRGQSAFGFVVVTKPEVMVAYEDGSTIFLARISGSLSSATLFGIERAIECDRLVVHDCGTAVVTCFEFDHRLACLIYESPAVTGEGALRPVGTGGNSSVWSAGSTRIKPEQIEIFIRPVLEDQIHWQSTVGGSVDSLRREALGFHFRLRFDAAGGCIDEESGGLAVDGRGVLQDRSSSPQRDDLRIDHTVISIEPSRQDGADDDEDPDLKGGPAEA